MNLGSDKHLMYTNVCTAVDLLNECTLQCLDQYAPVVERTFKKFPSPWITAELRERCKQRDKLYQRARRTGSLELLNAYRESRKLLKSDLLYARHEYIKSKIASTRDQASIWRILEKEGLTSGASQTATSRFTVQELNDHYCSISRAHPPCSISRLSDIINIPPVHTSTEFNFNEITPDEIHKTLISLMSKSGGSSSDNLPLKYLSRVLPPLLPYITSIFNLSISTNTYPSAWKRAYIIPLDKVSHPSTPAETRPIANLPHLAKVFDKLITNQILQYLEDNELLPPTQFGFRSGHSTQSALLHLTDIIRSGIENYCVTLLMQLDYSKAFDTISHEALLTALRELNFSENALRWVHSYITGRMQAVIDSQCRISKFQEVTSGVPQGSSPGPIFFIILMIKLPNFLKFCKNLHINFADDTQLFIQCPPNLLHFAIAHMNEEMQGVCAFSSSCGLNLNGKKSKAIIFGSRDYIAYVNSLTLPNLYVNGEVVEIVTQVKSLGVTLTNDLSWDTHVSSISSKVHGVLHKLRSRSWLFTKEVKIMLVQALVLPHIDYACLVFNDVNGGLNDKLQRLVNAGIRYIYNLKRRSNDSISALRHELGWLSVAERRRYFLGCTIYTILNSQRPLPLFNSLNNMFHEVRRSNRNSTDPPQINIPNSRTTSYKNSFLVTSARLWASLPRNIRESTSIVAFRTAFSNYLKGS